MDGGLFVNLNPASDYAYIDRHSSLVAYYNEQEALALEQGAKLAGWLGRRADAKAWRQRARAVAVKTAETFWDPTVGAFKDTPDAPVVHPQDGNAFAVLAGVGTRRQQLRALAYIGSADRRGYGNTIADSNLWADPARWGVDAKDRVYPFISYFEVVARFELGLDGSAFDLLRREWGYMAKNGPGTTWESIGPYGGGPVNGSWAHGWSTGAAPALTAYVLGVRPTSPGFATFVVRPHADDLTWARGVVPTPRGNITVSWHLTDRDTLAISVHAPRGERRVR